jgi:hypothetical protein
MRADAANAYQQWLNANQHYQTADQASKLAWGKEQPKPYIPYWKNPQAPVPYMQMAADQDRYNEAYAQRMAQQNFQTPQNSPYWNNGTTKGAPKAGGAPSRQLPSYVQQFFSGAGPQGPPQPAPTAPYPQPGGGGGGYGGYGGYGDYGGYPQSIPSPDINGWLYNMLTWRI